MVNCPLAMNALFWGLLPALLGMPPAPPEHPPSRAESLRLAREERRAHLEPNRQNRVQRALVALEKGSGPSLLAWNYHGLYPQLFVPISSGSRLAAGGRLWLPESLGPLDLEAIGLLSIARYRYLDLQIGRLPHAPGMQPVRSYRQDDIYELARTPRAFLHRFFAYASLRHRDFPQEDYYGLGTEAPRADRSNYRLEQGDAEVVLGFQPGPHFGLVARAAYVDPAVRPGEDDDLPSTEEVFDESTAPGIAGQPDFLRFGIQVLADLRDEPLNPHRGAFLAVDYAYLDGRGGGAYDFQRVAGEARVFLPLLSEQRVLAARAFVSLSDTRTGAEVPFYLMETLGGGSSLRGYHGQRYRDRDVLDLQVEYRFEANDAIEAALFADFGKAVGQPEDFRHGPWATSYGFGFRFKAPTRVALRMDLGFSPEHTRFFFRFAPSF